MLKLRVGSHPHQPYSRPIGTPSRPAGGRSGRPATGAAPDPLRSGRRALSPVPDRTGTTGPSRLPAPGGRRKPSGPWNEAKSSVLGAPRQRRLARLRARTTTKEALRSKRSGGAGRWVGNPPGLHRHERRAKRFLRRRTSNYFYRGWQSDVSPGQVGYRPWPERITSLTSRGQGYGLLCPVEVRGISVIGVLIEGRARGVPKVAASKDGVPVSGHGE